MNCFNIKLGDQQLESGPIAIINMILVWMRLASEFKATISVDLSQYEAYYKCSILERYFLPMLNSDIDTGVDFSLVHSIYPFGLLDSINGDKDFLRSISEIQKRNLVFNNTCIKRIDSDLIHFNKLKKEGASIMGALVRGTDYLSITGKNVPKWPDNKRIIKYCEKIMNDNQHTHLFLATEDSDVYAAFKDKFGELLIDIDQPRFSRKDFVLPGQLNKKLYDNNMLMADKYISSLYALSECDSFVGTPTSGSIFVSILKQDFKFFNIFYKGAGND